MEYEKLLKIAMEKVPKDVVESSRFELPTAVSKVQGNRTTISNFLKIADRLNRDTKHLMKFFDRELGTNGVLSEQSATFVGRFSTNMINEKIRKYAEEFVICKECGKPDTKLSKEDRLTIIKCTACGARRPARSIK
jgi:translation initiation factor 2 subunit 2